MAYQNITKQLRNAAKESRKKSAEKITETLLNAGLIEKAQRTIRNENILPAVALYRDNVLTGQDEKGSTGSNGKLFDLLERALMRQARGQSMDIDDLRCRPAGQKDITVYFADSRKCVGVEIKTGAGTLGVGNSVAEAWEQIAQAAESGKWIAWAFDTSPIDLNAADLRDAESRIAWLFFPVGELLGRLEEYGPLKTWLKENKSRNCVNWQEVKTSTKKLDFLWNLYEESWDFQHFRDTGILRKVSER